MVYALASLAVVGYLPGALAYRLPLADRGRRAALSVEERAFWAVVLSAAWSSLVALALAIAGCYSFERLLAADAGLATAILLGARGRLLYRDTARRPSWAALVPAALVCAGLWLYLPAAEFVIGGKDPGVYVNEGIAIAQRGGVILQDPLVAAIPAETRDLFFPSHHSDDYYGLRFMGFFILDPDAGTVVGQFPHLFPAWIAVGYGVDGLTGARSAVAVWAVLGLLAVYFAGARLVGRFAAGWAAALLAVSLVQTWFGRYPNAEVVMQALVFAGALAWARAHVDDDGFFAPVAGVLLGLLLFLRFDAVIIYAALGVATVLMLARNRWPRWSFLWPFGALVGLASAYLLVMMRPYMWRPLIFLANLRAMHVALMAAAVLALAVLAALVRIPRVARLVERWVPLALAGVLAAAAAYAYWLRQPVGRLAPHDAASLRTFTWYVPWAGLLAALAGYALVAWRRFWRDPLLLVTAAFAAVFVFYKIQIVPEHFWMTRRFLPVILPATLLMASAAASYGLWWRGPVRRGQAPADPAMPTMTVTKAATEAAPAPGRTPGGRWGAAASWRLALPLVFLGLLGWLLWRAAGPIRPHVEYAGLIPAVEKIAGRFGEDDLVIVESRNASDLHVIALPLAYVYAKNVLVLASPRPDRGQFGTLLAWATTRYRHVYFAGGGGTDLLSRTVSAVPVDSLRFQVPEWESAWNRYPRGVRAKEFDFGMYRLEAGTSTAGAFALDIGRLDDLHAVRFHAKQSMGETTYRWSRAASYVAMPGLGPGLTELTVVMGNGGRPETAEPARVRLSIDDTPIGEVVVDGGFRPYRFAIPPEVSARMAASDAPAQLRIVVNTWNPRSLLGVPDDRDIGVMVDRVELR